MSSVVLREMKVLLSRETATAFTAFTHSLTIHGFWFRPTLIDPVHDPRRIAVEKRIGEQRQARFSEKTLFDDFMTQWPTFNIATIMTTIMIPATGYHNTTVWYSYNPSGEQSH
jgi:hypothetical protein